MQVMGHIWLPHGGTWICASCKTRRIDVLMFQKKRISWYVIARHAITREEPLCGIVTALSGMEAASKKASETLKKLKVFYGDEKGPEA